MKRSPSGTAETTSDKYKKASVKHRYGEVASIRCHCITRLSLAVLHANLSSHFLYFCGSILYYIYYIYNQFHLV